MNLFDQLVESALRNRQDCGSLRVVVEKELLHQDILRILSQEGYLRFLTFMGGTCLRDCYGSPRLSEDLDFNGGTGFNKDDLNGMGRVIVKVLEEKYGLAVEVGDPVRETGNVDTWKIRVQTRPESRHLPSQRIHIDICSVPSRDRQPRMLINTYGIDMGTGGLIVQAESMEEILTDKLVALAMRPNRVKNRDLWDIHWLVQQRIAPKPGLLLLKLEDRHIELGDFREALDVRLEHLRTDALANNDFVRELGRFLPSTIAGQTLAGKDFWVYLMAVLSETRSRSGLD